MYSILLKIESFMKKKIRASGANRTLNYEQIVILFFTRSTKFTSVLLLEASHCTDVIYAKAI